MLIAQANLPIGIGSTGIVVVQIQEKLLSAGADLVADGDFGSITEAAIKRFQAANNLSPLGFVGPKTAAALDAIQSGTPVEVLQQSVLKLAPHLAAMRAITGTKELPGSANSPIIMSWRSAIANAFPNVKGLREYCMTYTGDEIPWCGFGAAYCFAHAGLMPPFGADATDKFMWAAAWGEETEYMVRIPDNQIFPGCMLTFTRNGGGHISMCERVNSDGSFYIRGCNQSDMVNVVPKSRSQFTVATWPRSLPIPAKGAIVGNISNAVQLGSEQ